MASIDPSDLENYKKGLRSLSKEEQEFSDHILNTPLGYVSAVYTKMRMDFGQNIADAQFLAMVSALLNSYADNPDHVFAMISTLRERNLKIHNEITKR